MRNQPVLNSSYNSITVTRAQATTLPVQARVKNGADALGAEYRCSKCAIAYSVPHGDRAGCPMCALEKQLTLTQLRNKELEATLSNLQVQLDRLRIQVDDVAAIREALPLAEGQDMAWIKGVMYRYRADKGISLMTAYIPASPKFRGARSVSHNAFLLVYRGEENETYRPTSIGGIAIVGTYAEIIRQLGIKTAMSYLLRAMSPVLTGGAPE